MPDKPRHLWLLGLSGSGKSTVGPRLAQALGLPWVDTDAAIAREAGQSIPVIFQNEGEEGFRNRESAVLEKTSAGPSSVVSCGGGIILRERNRRTLAATGLRIYLRADPSVLAQRLRSSHARPLLAGEDREASLASLLAQRAPLYEESEILLDVSRLDPEATVAAIRDRLPAPWSP